MCPDSQSVGGVKGWPLFLNVQRQSVSMETDILHRINAATFFFRENPPLPLEFGTPLDDRVDERHLGTNRGAG